MKTKELHKGYCYRNQVGVCFHCPEKSCLGWSLKWVLGLCLHLVGLDKISVAGLLLLWSEHKVLFSCAQKSWDLIRQTVLVVLDSFSIVLSNLVGPKLYLSLTA